jgi:hypothetical protein
MRSCFGSGLGRLRRPYRFLHFPVLLPLGLSSSGIAAWFGTIPIAANATIVAPLTGCR